MRDWYDNPRLEDIFDEQATKLPSGPLGLLEPPEVKLVEGFSPKELELIRALKAKKIGTMKFLNRDSEPTRIPSNLVQRDQPVVSIEGSVFQTFGHDGTCDLLKLHREAHHCIAIPLRLVTGRFREQHSVDKIEHA